MVGETDPSPENRPDVRTNAIFKKMDLNDDRVLSKEEFVRGCINDEHLYNLLARAGNWKEEDGKDEILFPNAFILYPFSLSQNWHAGELAQKFQLVF